MKYGFLGAFIKFAFGKTAFGFMEKEVPVYQVCFRQDSLWLYGKRGAGA